MSTYEGWLFFIAANAVKLGVVVLCIYLFCKLVKFAMKTKSK